MQSVDLEPLLGVVLLVVVAVLVGLITANGFRWARCSQELVRKRYKSKFFRYLIILILITITYFGYAVADFRSAFGPALKGENSRSDVLQADVNNG
ncbi:MAG: hypothetical protein HUU55_11135 [Myxococcales bacterium]|nr:hypothetical protein [Myxococcales bacterium]